MGEREKKGRIAEGEKEGGVLGKGPLRLKQFCIMKQKVNQAAMEKSVIVIKVMRNIHADHNFFKER